MVKRTETDVPWTEGRDIWWHDLVDGQSDQHTPEAFDAEQPLFILYTSGTTGKPKGILHTSGGYLTQAAYTHHAVFDLKPDSDVYWCTADIGWVTGHSYIVYGPLANRATSVIYEGTPNTPHEGRHWEIVQKYGVSDLLHRADADPHVHEVGRGHPGEVRPVLAAGARQRSASRSTPRRGCGTGENIGGDRCPIVDTWWQTETGAIMIAPLPGVTETKPGLGDAPAAGHLRGRRRRGRQRRAGKGGGGYLVLDKPWPSMLRGIWGDERALPGHLLVALRRAGLLLRRRRRQVRRATARSGCSAGSTT